jgi:hypothetical protein
MLGRRQQAREHARLEQGVTVQDHEFALHLASGDPAAHQIVGRREKRVVKGADFLRVTKSCETGLDRVRAVAYDHRDINDAASHQGFELPRNQRAPVHRQHAFRDALGKRQQSAALARAQDNRFHA